MPEEISAEILLCPEIHCHQHYLDYSLDELCMNYTNNCSSYIFSIEFQIIQALIVLMLFKTLRNILWFNVWVKTKDFSLIRPSIRVWWKRWESTISPRLSLLWVKTLKGLGKSLLTKRTAVFLSLVILWQKIIDRMIILWWFHLRKWITKCSIKATIFTHSKRT